MIHHAPPDAYELEYLAWYLRSTYTAGEPFDPSQLVQLARQKWKKQPALADAFARCTQQWRYGEYYTYLLAPDYQRNGGSSRLRSSWTTPPGAP